LPWGNAYDQKVLLNNENYKATSFCATTKISWLEKFVTTNNANSSTLEEFEKDESLLLNVVDERFLKAAAYGDISLWLKMLTGFETSVLLPLQTLLNKGVISQVRFVTPTEKSFVYKKYYRYRFYRKNKSLKTLCGRVL